MSAVTEPVSAVDLSDPGVSRPSGVAEFAGPSEFSLGDVLAVLARHWRLALILPLLAGTFALVRTLREPRVYHASASFVPQGGDAATSRLAGLAAQFGVSGVGGGGDVSRSPAFYVELLRSDELLRQTVLTEYTTAGPRGAQRRSSLVQLLDVDSTVNPRSVERAIDVLRASMTAESRRETGIVEFGVTTTSPDLSRQIGDRVLELVNQFNVQSRQAQAGAERVFAEERLAAANAELRVAEGRLVSFLEANRYWQGSPALVGMHDRLEREVGMRQQVATSLVQAYETARINEVRNTPVIVTVERPVTPARPVSRRVAEKTMLGAVAGAVVALLAVLAMEGLASMRQRDPAAYARLTALRGRLRGARGQGARAT